MTKIPFFNRSTQEYSTPDVYSQNQQLTEAILKGTPIIVVTTMAMAADQEKIIAAGADGYLPKPIQVNEFTDAVRKVLEG